MSREIGVSMDKQTNIYAAWFGEMSNIKPEYVENLTKNARLNPRADIILYVNADSPEELKSKSDMFQNKAGRDAGRIRVVNIYDQLDLDANQGIDFANEIKDLIKGLLLPYIINSKDDRGYAYLKDMVMYYTAATKLDDRIRTVILDLDVIPVRSIDSLYKNRNSPVVLDYINQGSRKGNALSDFFVIDGNPMDLQSKLRREFLKKLGNKSSNLTLLVRKCTFCVPLTLDILQHLGSTGEQSARVERRTYLPEYNKVILNKSKSLCNDKTTEEQTQELQQASLQLVSKAFRQSGRYNQIIEARKFSDRTNLTLPMLAQENIELIRSRFGNEIQISRQNDHSIISMPTRYLVPMAGDPITKDQNLSREVRDLLKLAKPKVMSGDARNAVTPLLKTKSKVNIIEQAGKRYADSTVKCNMDKGIEERSQAA